MKTTKSILISMFIAFLGAWAGAEGTNKNWRRILIPILLTALALLTLKNWWCLTIMSMAIAFSMGYGIPDLTDNGSALGKFWYNLFNNNVLWTNRFTRGTIGLLVNLSLIVIPILKGNWIITIPCFLVVMIVYIFFSWKDLGGVWVKNKYLLGSDIVVYGAIGLATAVLVYL